MIRTHTAGSLDAGLAGQTVILAGWVARRRDHGGVIFIDLRDASGLAQVVFREGDMAAAAHRLRSEFCIQVTGTVDRRPPGNENPELPSGQVEVTAADLRVLSESAPLPFPVHGSGSGEVGEDARLHHRYLDLRRAEPARILRMRSRVNEVARRVMAERDFVEVETPTLTRSTPEGARDFLVPVRLQPGSWYALPQSPQLFKQLLMVAGLERYYQIARCYRDEDFRADRQPEFTQLDIEMSFVDQDDVMQVGEAVVAALWRDLRGVDLPLPIPRLRYAEAMRRYGSDKPDLRLDLELVDLTAYFAGTEFRVFQAEHVGAVVMPGGADQPRKVLDGWQDWARSRGAKGLAYVLVGDDGELRGPVAKNLSPEHRAGLAAAAGAKPGDCVFFAADTRPAALALLGATRLEVGRRCGLIDEAAWRFVWIVDMPMFEATEDGGWTALHHPFTGPTREWEDRFDREPADALAYAYDIVCNGNEIGGGSIRIHRADVQQRLFDVIGLDERQAKQQFGFLLEAFGYGPPPHGGIAFGWDRICALLAGTDSIRDVIAFPKTGAGFDPLTGAPAPITAAQRAEAGIDAAPAGPAAAGPNQPAPVPAQQMVTPPS